MCSIRLGKELALSFFSIVGAAGTICVILLWILVTVKTVIAGWRGDIFYGLNVKDKLPEFTGQTDVDDSDGEYTTVALDV